MRALDPAGVKERGGTSHPLCSFELDHRSLSYCQIMELFLMAPSLSLHIARLSGRDPKGLEPTVEIRTGGDCNCSTDVS